MIRRPTRSTRTYTLFPYTTLFGSLHGYYTWDGATCPDDAEPAINQVYGDVVWARLSMQSAVDQRRYETANALHGFLPVVDWLDETGSLNAGPQDFRYSLQDFVTANSAYCDEGSAVLEKIVDLSTDPYG